uniref:Global nitrogen transcriptional regulator n=1 Tax=Digenea simplex TaxID=945030 RepID=A0A1Z1MV76_DIGSM|nr:global nitrogen transcriptional regulator [Digenea simplex]ARW69624.1 global nitrogen transcriptional regulator [Digenea simplex]
MKWINFLSYFEIPYYIYQLNKEDALIIHNDLYDNQIIIIIHGSIYINKIFSNKQLLPVAMINKNSIFKINKTNINNQFYYKLTALEKTYLASFRLNKVKKNKEFKTNLLTMIINSYEKTTDNYHNMNQIISQKYLKNKVYQIILLMCLQFGIVQKNQIYIPLKISYKNLAEMVGTNTIAINKIMKEINKNLTIEFSKKRIIYIPNIFKLKLK